MLKSLTISGYRGYSEPTEIKFAVPDQSANKIGLTIIVGANNSGKSSLLEAISLFSKDSSRSVSKEQRNIKVKSIVDLKALLEDNTLLELKNMSGSATLAAQPTDAHLPIFRIPSRRTPNSFYFGNSKHEIYELGNELIISSRGKSISLFNSVINSIDKEPGQKRKQKLNKLIEEIIGYPINWNIDIQQDQHFINFIFGDAEHNTEGLGEGLLSLLILLLPFSQETFDSILIIDEPELSLHPAVQKKLFDKYIELSKHIQIILCTHSPYFVDLELINQGAEIIRVFKDEAHNINIGQIEHTSVKELKKLFTSSQNPHVLGTVMKEILFLSNKIIVTEGQEDVIGFKRVAKELKIDIEGEFFGWGSGGYSNILKICQILKDLKYQRVLGIFDAKTSEYKKAKKLFPEYTFIELPTEDIKDKKECTYQPKIGMLDNDYKLKNDYKEDMISILNKINKSFKN